MPFLSHPLSIVEVVALVVAGLVALAVVVSVAANLRSLLRYLHIRKM
jgi:hypothetical protein